MLSSITPADVAASTRVRFRMGAWLFASGTAISASHLEQVPSPAKPTVKPGGAGAATAGRPQASQAAVLIGSGAQAAGQAESASQQRTSNAKYAHTTRIIALMGGGSLGPHPARDPV